MSEPDEGIYDAMNKGLRSLDGDYVCFLNAGDFLPAADTVSKIVGYISLAAGEENMPAVLYGDTISLMAKAVSCTIVVSRRPRISHGNRSVKACLYAIKLFMRGLTLP